MLYFTRNRKTEETMIFTSITQISRNTNLKKDRLYYIFSRNKDLYFVNERYFIQKIEVNQKI